MAHRTIAILILTMGLSGVVEADPVTTVSTSDFMAGGANADDAKIGPTANDKTEATAKL